MLLLREAGKSEIMSAPKEIERCAIETLGDARVEKGDTVLDCCCGCGTYTAPAAKLVGKEGFVYAVDINRNKLDDLKSHLKSNSLSNVSLIRHDVTRKIPLPNYTVDITLLFDIFWYFRPYETSLLKLIEEVQRIVKPAGLVSVIPKHINEEQLQYFKTEMRNFGFAIIEEIQRNLVHDDAIEQGELLNFQKPYF